ncbi:MAG: LpqB family beta-propeller domain-containing protein [Blastocatellia bacterium]|nr:LpqB family beta-propeller domain-containing protein [Blastocatellia bacterium]
MARLRKLYIYALALLLTATALPAATVSLAQSAKPEAPASIPLFAEPAISPDRSEIAFVSGGDIWTVPAQGGEARLLISHPATESRPIYSPDGRSIAFISDRTGNGDIYLLTLDTGELKRLTFDDANDQLDAWSRNGRWIYFSSTSRDIAGMNDIFRVSISGGTPMQVSADRYVNEFFSAPSSDGRTIAFTARGVSSSQWWRKGHSHIDESEIWLMREGAPPAYERVTEGGAKEMWPMWNGDGAGLFYVSDRSGAQNVWMRPLRGQARQVTKFKDGRVLWPNVSYDGRAIVFERDFQIWKLDTESGQAAEVRITRRGAPAVPVVEHLRLTDRIQEFALSPDGKKIAFVVRGEVFAAAAKTGGDAARVTTSPASEYQVTWAPDSRRIVYVSDRDRTAHLYLYDFTNNTETELTRDAKPDATPRFSPDGKMLAFERDGRELCVIDMESKQERVLAEGIFGKPPLNSDRPFVWSPDNRWIAFLTPGEKSFTNVYMVPAAGGESRPVSFLANTFANAVSWSPDGKFILFNTRQRTEDGQIARVDLIPRTPRFREDLFRDLFKEEAPRSPANRNREARPPQPATPDETPAADERKKPDSKPVEVVFDGIRRRLGLLSPGVDPGYQVISPDGKLLLMIAGAAGQQNLYTYSLDELSREPPVARQLTSTAGFKSDAQFSPDGKEVFYLERGRINVVSLDARSPRPVAVTAEMDVDFETEKKEVFHQAWSYLRDYFYDSNYHGADWQAVRAYYEPRINGSRTPDEMRRALQLMVGELNASHLGVSSPPGNRQTSTGRLGLLFDRAEYESAGRLRITEVIALGPAAIAGNIKPGDYLLAVDGAQIAARTNLDELLDHRVGRRVALTVASSSDGADKREVIVRPVNQGTEKGLIYRQWVESRRDYVARVSKGRLGYVHMVNMSAGALAQLYVDLDVENHSREGVVIDIRNNSGGFVNAYALDVFARRGYMTMTRRGFGPAPARSMLGQRALELPTILVTNQHSLSDAEDFTEGYRTLKLGKVVGEPTAGWIIYTTNVTLIDGSGLRLPFIKITGSDGKVMELVPRPVDLAVQRPIGEGYTDRDTQLDVAVRELLKQIGGREASNPARR